MNPKHAEREHLLRLRREVEKEIDGYVYEVPDGAVGTPMTVEAVDDQLAQLRASLVDPYWEEVELRDAFEHVGMHSAPRRRCAVVADDGKGILLLFDPVENQFVLAQRGRVKLCTFGVRGDAVGCFLSR